MRHVVAAPLAFGCLFLLLVGLPAQELSSPRITPEMLGLPPGNRRTAEPDEIRVYPVSESDPTKEDRSKGPIWIESADNKEYTLNKGEIQAFHNALDFSSRKSAKADPSPLPFKAGVYGTVVSAKKGQIVVKMPTGNFMIYQHNSTVDVKIGDRVTPQTVLGKTGKVSTKNLHLHLQACDFKGKLIDPDRAFLGGRIKPKASTPRKIKMVIPEWVDVGPIYLGRRPRVVDGIVKADQENKRIYYEDNAPKLSPSEKAVVGTWRNGTNSLILKEDKSWIEGNRKGTWKVSGDILTVRGLFSDASRFRIIGNGTVIRYLSDNQFVSITYRKE